jgi:hypothetical protein
MSLLDTLEGQTLDAVAAVQDAVIAMTKTVAARTEPVSKFLPQIPPVLPSPSTLVIGMFAIAEKQLSLADKIVANQKAFVAGLADAQTSQSTSKGRAKSPVKDAA